jgi:acyl-CoA synthetase (AMP-forming)/AMP-acid ligase II
MGSMSTNTEQGTLLVTSIEEKTRWFSNHTVFRYPSPNWEKDGYRSLTWVQWNDAINKVAFWLDEQLGAGKNKSVAYLGPSDLRYSVIIPALIKTGRKAGAHNDDTRKLD